MVCVCVCVCVYQAHLRMMEAAQCPPTAWSCVGHMVLRRAGRFIRALSRTALW